MRIINIDPSEIFDFFEKNKINYNIKYFIKEYAYESSYIIAVNETNEMMGILAFNKENNDVFNLNYVSVHSQFQKKGVATKLIDELLKQIDKGKLLVSSYSEEGTALIKTIIRLSFLYSEVTVFHKIKGEYQNTKFPNIKIGDNISYIENNHLEETGFVNNFFLDKEYKFCIEVCSENKSKLIYPNSIKIIN